MIIENMLYEFDRSGVKYNMVFRPPGWRISVSSVDLLTKRRIGYSVPFTCFETVGTAEGFSEGVFTVPYGDDSLFLDIIRRIWEDELYKDYWKLDKMKALILQVEQFTWSRFVEDHYKVWGSVI
jgi:hypothetical protein